jgi:hypothetical protein
MTLPTPSGPVQTATRMPTPLTPRAGSSTRWYRRRHIKRRASNYSACAHQSLSPSAESPPVSSPATSASPNTTGHDATATHAGSQPSSSEAGRATTRSGPVAASTGAATWTSCDAATPRLLTRTIWSSPRRHLQTHRFRPLQPHRRLQRARRRVLCPSRRLRQSRRRRRPRPRLADARDARRYHLRRFALPPAWPRNPESITVSRALSLCLSDPQTWRGGNVASYAILHSDHNALCRITLRCPCREFRRSAPFDFRYSQAPPFARHA